MLHRLTRSSTRSGTSRRRFCPASAWSSPPRKSTPSALRVSAATRRLARRVERQALLALVEPSHRPTGPRGKQVRARALAPALARASERAVARGTARTPPTAAPAARFLRTAPPAPSSSLSTSRYASNGFAKSRSRRSSSRETREVARARRARARAEQDDWLLPSVCLSASSSGCSARRLRRAAAARATLRRRRCARRSRPRDAIRFHRALGRGRVGIRGVSRRRRDTWDPRDVRGWLLVANGVSETGVGGVPTFAGRRSHEHRGAALPCGEVQRRRQRRPAALTTTRRPPRPPAAPGTSRRSASRRPPPLPVPEARARRHDARARARVARPCAGVAPPQESARARWAAAARGVGGGVGGGG